MELLSKAPPRPKRSTLTVAENRQSLEQLAVLFGAPAPMVTRTTHYIDEVFTVRYTPPESNTKGVCVYAHGGGWALGSTNTHDAYCSRLAGMSGCSVVSVEYRRPPEHPYPAALDDLVTVIEAIQRGYLSDLDTSRIAVAGDSAGANLAASAAIRLRSAEFGAHPIRFVALLMPVLDNRPELYRSYQYFAEGFSLTADDMSWYWERYAGADWAHRAESDLVPMQAPDLTGFPTTLVLTAECDVLRDEGEAFARRLVEAGTTVTQVRKLGTFHPFLLFLDTLESAGESLQVVAQALSQEIGDSRPTVDGS